jgi:hypothetical protein
MPFQPLPQASSQRPSLPLAASSSLPTDPAPPPAQPAAPGAAVPDLRTPYTPPAIIFRSGMEAIAANCYDVPGKVDGRLDCLVGSS